MSEITPITREEKLWNGEDLEPITREEMYIKRIFDKTQTIPDKPLTRKEILMEKAGEGGGGDVTIKQLSVTANGTYSEEGTAYSPVNVAVPLAEKSVTENGVYNASADSVAGYSKVNVNVPLPENAYLLKTAIGSLVSFADGADLPMPSFICNIIANQDLHGYDGPWVGGAGKNKLPMTVDGIKSANTDGTWTGNNYALNGITYTILTDNDRNVTGIKANGTASANAILDLNPTGSLTIPANTTFSLSGCPEGGGGSTYRLYPKGGTSATYDNGSGKLITLDSAITNPFRINVYSGAQVDNIIFYPMIVFTNAIDMDFAPYSNICPISGHTGVDAWVCGKNWLSTNFTEGNGINSSGAVVDNSSRSATVEAIRVIPNSTYTVSYTGNERWGWFAYNSNNERIDSASWFYSGDNFTTPPGTYYVRFVYASGTAPTNVQLEIGETASAYTPYNGQTISVSWQTEAGEVYGGYVDLVSGVLTVDKGYMTFNGTEDWKITSSTSGSNYVVMDDMESGYRMDGICSQFATAIDGTSEENAGKCQFGSNNTRFYIVAAQQTYGADTKEKMQELTTGMQIVYPLATPQTYQLTPQQIKSLRGNNNAWCSTGDVDIDYFAKEV